MNEDVCIFNEAQFYGTNKPVLAVPVTFFTYEKNIGSIKKVIATSLKTGTQYNIMFEKEISCIPTYNDVMYVVKFDDDYSTLIPKQAFEQRYQLQSMLQTHANQVKEMHAKFGITNDKVVFSEQEKQFRIDCLQEELDEFKEATTKEDRLDALIDLCVFLHGTVERMGFENVFDEGFRRVMKANMQKELGANNKRGSFSIDLKKPKCWKAPDLSDLVNLGEHFVNNIPFASWLNKPKANKE